MFTLPQWIARLTKGYIKATGKQPDGLAKLKIKMEATQRVKDQSKVVDITSKIKDDWWKARSPKVTAEKATPIKKFLSDDEATFQIQKLQAELPHMKRMEVLQLMDDITAKKAYGAFDDVQRKELLDTISKVYTRKPDFASGGIAGQLHLYDGGRARFDKGKKVDLSKRRFLKGTGAALGVLSALPFVGKFFKAAKPLTKVAATVEKAGAGTGMPVWFPKFIERALKEGTDVTGVYGTVERQIVKKINLPDSKTEVLVHHDLVSGDTMVDVGLGKHGFDSGRYGQPAQLNLKKGEVITEGKMKGQTEPDDFFVEEAEFTGGHPENVKFEESVTFNYGEHGSDFAELEKYATGKNIDKKTLGKQADRDAWAEGQAESRAEQMAEEGLDEFAQGGRASYTKGGLAKILGV